MDDPKPEDQPPAKPNDNEGTSQDPSSSIPQSTFTGDVASAESGPAPSPTPGHVITGSHDQSRPAHAAPKVVTSNHGGGKKRWLKVLIILVALALIVGGGWYLYHKHQNNKTAANQNKDIPLLKIGTYQSDGYGSLYPNMSDNEYSYMVNSQMFEGLVRYENKSTIVPDLASGWTNPNSTTWIFTIKSGIKFHDGHTLTANDVKYSLNNILNNSSSALNQDFATTIASVDVVGSNQVKITTNVPDPVLLNKLNFLYIIDANLPKGDEPSQAGTGPYEIKAGTKPNSSNLQMVAFNDYHGGRPTVQAVDFGSSNSSAQLLAAFKDHQYNIVGPMPNTDQKVNAVPFNVSEADVFFIGLNTVQPGPLQNKLVREAIRYALDPVAIGKSNDKSITPANQLIPPSIPGYNPAIPMSTQDVAKAKQLLTQAGYPNGLTLRFSESEDLPSELTELTNEFKAVGITLTIDPHNDFTDFVNYFTNGQAEMFDVDYSSDTLDGLDIFTTTLPTTNYNNPQFTDLLNQANTTTDPAKRLKILQQAGVIVNQDVPVVPLYSENDLWLMDKNYVIKQDMPSSLLSVYLSNVQLR